MRRREFIAALGSAVALPLASHAQQPERMRRIGVLVTANDPVDLIAAVVPELARLGWVEGRNVRIDRRWTNNDADLARTYAKELAALQPDVILAVGSPVTAALQRETRTIPIVFVGVYDPVVQGFVAGLPRPGGNVTGFGYAEPIFAGKISQMLKEIAPGIRCIAFMYNPDFAPWAKSFQRSFEAAAKVLAVDPVNIPVHGNAEIETNMEALGSERSGLVSADAFIDAHRATVIAAATRNKVPAIHIDPAFARDGGLMSYGASRTDMYYGAASYVDRILRGARPSELPVQYSTKFELVINLKTAKAPGLTIPPNLLAVADEVIE
jgi:putative ABC transport system substrate-binding protein